MYVTYPSPMHSTQGKGLQTIGFAYSDGDGATFKQRVFAPPDVGFKDRMRVGPSPTDLLVAPDGTIVLAYIYYLSPESSASDKDQAILETLIITSSDGR